MNWQNLKIKLKLRVAIGTILTVFSTFAIIAILQLISIRKDTQKLSHNRLPFVSGLTEMERNWHHAVLYFRAYTGNSREVDYYQALSYINQTKTELEKLKSMSIGISLTDDIEEIEQRISNFQQVMQAFFSNKQTPEIVSLTNQINILNVKCKELIEQEIWLSVKSAEQTTISAKYSLNMIMIGFFITLIISLYISGRLAYSINKPIKMLVNQARQMSKGKFSDMKSTSRNDEFGILINSYKESNEKFKNIIGEVIQLSTLLNKISYTLDKKAENLNLTTNDQAVYTEELSATMDNIRLFVQQNTIDADDSQKLIYQFASELTQTSTKIVEAIEVMQQLIDKSTTVRAIATETYILSLNARVEAAKAGDAGRGFAVVANGIKQLAEQSQSLSHEITKISNKGIDISGSIKTDLMSIDKKLKVSLDISHKIKQSGDQQHREINMVAQNINHVNTGVQQTAIDADYIAREAGALISEAQKIKSTLAFFNRTDDKPQTTNQNYDIDPYALNVPPTQIETIAKLTKSNFATASV